jgi:hypothetical protein
MRVREVAIGSWSERDPRSLWALVLERARSQLVIGATEIASGFGGGVSEVAIGNWCDRDRS